MLQHTQALQSYGLSLWHVIALGWRETKQIQPPCVTLVPARLGCDSSTGPVSFSLSSFNIINVGCLNVKLTPVLNGRVTSLIDDGVASWPYISRTPASHSKLNQQKCYWI
ncbi:hypothetical protein RRG08_052975 [Elysia crispata]|uniref:Uncharacterized protein n=1 Tax=Elysia crispata TaxID=231223 RepID=A0AAE0ZK36_9GAST|nr:hypothetical protein RRG08_052975 [Elysia crispata]